MRTRPIDLPRRIRRPGMFEGGDGSTLSLDFTAMSGLDSRFTFSRASTATFINSSGLVQYADANMVVNADFVGAGTGNTPTAWTGSTGINLSIPATGVRRAETTTAAQNWIGSLNFTTSNGLTYSTSVQINAVSGQHYANTLTITGSPTVVGYYLNGSSVGQFATAQPGLLTVVWTATGTHAIRIGIGSTGANIANGVCEFTQPRTVPGNFTQPTFFANSSTTVAYYAPRFDHDPATLQPRGLLIEGSVTNLVTRSQAWNTSPWSGSNIASVSETGSGSPEGISTSQVLTFTNGTAAGSAFWQNANIPVSASTAYTWSVWVKTGNTKATFFCRNNGFAASRHIILDLTVTPPTATVDIGSSYGFTSVSTPTVQEYPNGWYRITTGGTTPAGTTNLWIGFQNRDAIPASGTNTVTGFGLQLEAGSGASSYIPTGSGTVQRAADNCEITGTNFSSWFNATGGTFLAHARRIRTTDVGRIASANDNTANESIDLGASTTGQFIVTDGGSALATITPGTVTANTAFKIAGAFELNNVQAALNGTLGTADTSVTMPTVTQLHIGRQGGASPVYLNGTVSLLKYWPTRLPDATLQSLTQ